MGDYLDRVFEQNEETGELIPHEQKKVVEKIAVFVGEVSGSDYEGQCPLIYSNVGKMIECLFKDGKEIECWLENGDSITIVPIKIAQKRGE